MEKTIFQNTLVINGKGQIGEGRWLVNTKFMGAKELPCIVYTKSNKEYDYVIGNAKPAYPATTHLTTFYRHFLYLKPDCWVVADEVQADSTSLFEFYYHSNFPFKEIGSNQFKVEGTRGSMTMTVLKPSDVTATTFLQDIESTNIGSIASRLNVLKVSSQNKKSDLFINVIESYATGSPAKIKASIVAAKGENVLVLKTAKGTKTFKIMSDRKDKNTPLLIETKNLIN